MTPPHGYAPTPHQHRKGVNVKAIWSLPCAVAVSVLGLVLAHLARSEIRRTGERGDGLALTALIIGYPVTVIWVVFWLSLLLSIQLAT